MLVILRLQLFFSSLSRRRGNGICICYGFVVVVQFRFFFSCNYQKFIVRWRLIQFQFSSFVVVVVSQIFFQRRVSCKGVWAAQLFFFGFFCIGRRLEGIGNRICIFFRDLVCYFFCLERVFVGFSFYFILELVVVFKLQIIII